MALDPIVRGCDWYAVLVVEPTAGRSVADVVVDLTGATVAVRLFASDETEIAVGIGAVLDPSARKIGLEFAAAVTSAIASQVGAVLDVRLTTSGGKTRPIQVRERIEVRALTSGGRP